PGDQGHRVAPLGHGDVRVGVLFGLPAVGGGARAGGVGVPALPRPPGHLRRRPGSHQPRPQAPPRRLPGDGALGDGGPHDPAAVLRQQLRWKKSWLRESLEVCRYFWRKNPAAALFTYASIIFPFLAPRVVLHAVLGRLLWGAASGLWFYRVGTYAMALLYSLYYAFRRMSALWPH